MNYSFIAKYVIDFILNRKSEKNKNIKKYLNHIEKICTELVELEDPKSDKAALLHEKIKVLYDITSQNLPANIMNDCGEILYRALSNARIYYWVRLSDNQSKMQLERMIKMRKERSTSFDIMLKRMDEYNKITDTQLSKSEILAKIKEACLIEIASLSSIPLINQ